MLKWPVWIGVVCEDLAVQRVFYREVLGLNETRVEAGFVWFSLDGRMFELLSGTGLKAPGRARVVFGFEVDDIVAAREVLLTRGAIAVSASVEGGPEAQQYWAIFQDPEGNHFELTQRAVSTG